MKSGRVIVCYTDTRTSFDQESQQTVSVSLTCLKRLCALRRVSRRSMRTLLNRQRILAAFRQLCVPSRARFLSRIQVVRPRPSLRQQPAKPRAMSVTVPTYRDYDLDLGAFCVLTRLVLRRGTTMMIRLSVRIRMNRRLIDFPL